MIIHHALLENPARLRLVFSEPPQALTSADIILTPAVQLRALEVEGNDLLVDTADFNLCRPYTVLVHGVGIRTVDVAPCLKSLQPSAPMGCEMRDGFYFFRIFAPRAESVRLLLFDRPEQTVGTEYFLGRGEQGVWELSLHSSLRERYYAYRVDGPRGVRESFNGQITIGDPYARAVVTANTWRHPARCVLPGLLPGYDWEGDTFVTIDPADLVMYELHVRDMTAHPSSGVAPALAGTYSGLVTKHARGGIGHIRALGVNAVELMPCQQFAALEPPYQRHVGEDLYNHWNPYERNHWGYMTSFYFAPEPGYSASAVRTAAAWNTAAPAHLTEFRDMVKAFHREGIAVIMDVVYNHTSQYDYQPLKYLDARYYYRHGPDGAPLAESGCGNDFATEMPMARRLIVDSVVYWLKEFHIDGFRFDLAAMIDVETMREVAAAAKAVHPGVILIAEPWGGGQYDLQRFSDLGMGAWNDHFRNGVKGRDPLHAKGYVFGEWGESVPEDFGKWMLGSVRGKGGPFLQHTHTVNYLESHDGYTFGDFLRIATGSARPGQRIGELRGHVTLRPDQLRIAKLAAVMLLTARGAVMLHAGQEFARSKVIADRGVSDAIPGILDHNSYEKDDETNWLDYEHAEWNRPLLEYYRGLIALRARFRTLRHAPIENYRFLAANVSMAGGFEVKGVGEEPELIVLINGNLRDHAEYALPQGMRWSVYADENAAGASPLNEMHADRVSVPPGTCLVLAAAHS